MRSRRLAFCSATLFEPGLRLMPTRSSALAVCVRFILDRLDDGRFGAFWASNFGAVLALHAEGFSFKHPAITHLLEVIEKYRWEDEQGLQMQVTHGPVWDTGLMALGLLENGLQTETMDHRQILDVRGDFHKRDQTLARGGWCYQDCDTYYPDNDDTLIPLLCIVMHMPEELRSKSCIAAIEFLLGMQCSNGVWACFDGWNICNFWLNQKPFGQGNEFFDPSVPDITGRVIECYGILLAKSDTSGKELINSDLYIRMKHACHKAIRYLASVQDAQGLWGSRWHVNYLNGTYSVLCGIKFFLHEIEDSLEASFVEEMVQRPLTWVKTMQNKDGDAGRGDSTPTQTAWAIMTLLAHLPPEDHCIVQGVQYLVRTQTTGPSVSEEDGAGIGTGLGATWRLRDYYHEIF
ncbi:terpenoid cyclases/Protein prenyltransferase [Bimuria novae-zelandiae CBS 107.79]|uniref:Terpenoid cyclases/Protein prenyltransferase n=1 Tax=Bimuria novae-zelandiae CBS 107.79 TaxID=1447943 RepID=A0A6A5UTE9_9PLEO|nr:terpenoid cyclases/Protein prenyltransferase [Bimuria novae-zelandiae CBS 107.79]